MKTKRVNQQETPALHGDERMSLEEQIAQRAHELRKQSGHKHGSDLADWLHAEREINEWHQQRLRAEAARQRKTVSV